MVTACTVFSTGTTGTYSANVGTTARHHRPVPRYGDEIRRGQPHPLEHHERRRRLTRGRAGCRGVIPTPFGGKIFGPNEPGTRPGTAFLALANTRRHQAALAAAHRAIDQLRREGRAVNYAAVAHAAGGAVSTHLDPAYPMEGLTMARFRRTALISAAVVVPIALIAVLLGLHVAAQDRKDSHWHIGIEGGVDSMAFALLAVLRLICAFLTRRRLAAWETAWSTVGPQWSRGWS